MKKTLILAAACTTAFAAAQRMGTLPMTPQHAALLLVGALCIGVAALIRASAPELPLAFAIGMAVGMGALLAGMAMSGREAGDPGVMVSMFASSAATAMLMTALPRMRWSMPPLFCFFGLLSLLGGLSALSGAGDAGTALVFIGLGTMLLAPLPFLGQPNRPSQA